MRLSAVYTHIHTYIHTYRHAHTHTHTHIHTHTYTHTHAHIHTENLLSRENGEEIWLICLCNMTFSWEMAVRSWILKLWYTFHLLCSRNEKQKMCKSDDHLMMIPAEENIFFIKTMLTTKKVFFLKVSL